MPGAEVSALTQLKHTESLVHMLIAWQQYTQSPTPTVTGRTQQCEHAIQRLLTRAFLHVFDQSMKQWAEYIPG